MNFVRNHERKIILGTSDPWDDSVVPANQRTEVRFASFLSGGFITTIVVNPPERKLAKRTSVECTGMYRKLPPKHKFNIL